MTKHPYTGAPTRKQKRPNKPKRKGGRPRRPRPSEGDIDAFVRPWIPNVFGDVPRVARIATALKDGVPWTLPEVSKEDVLAVLRGMEGVDDFTIAEEAYRYLAAKDGRRVKRNDRIDAIAGWLKMDPAKLTNWLNRSRRVR